MARITALDWYGFVEILCDEELMVWCRVQEGILNRAGIMELGDIRNKEDMDNLGMVNRDTVSLG